MLPMPPVRLGLLRRGPFYRVLTKPANEPYRLELGIVHLLLGGQAAWLVLEVCKGTVALGDEEEGLQPACFSADVVDQAHQICLRREVPNPIACPNRGLVHRFYPGNLGVSARGIWGRGLEGGVGPPLCLGFLGGPRTMLDLFSPGVAVDVSTDSRHTWREVEDGLWQEVLTRRLVLRLCKGCAPCMISVRNLCLGRCRGRVLHSKHLVRHDLGRELGRLGIVVGSRLLWLRRLLAHDHLARVVAHGGPRRDAASLLMGRR